MNTKVKLKMKKVIAIILMIVTLGIGFTACNQAERVSSNISKEADNFNVVRRLVVLNGRTDNIFMEVTGVFSFTVSDERIIIVGRTGENTYVKHSCGLPKEAFWSVEDISGADVSSYSYEVNFLPEMIKPFEFTSTGDTDKWEETSSEEID